MSGCSETERPKWRRPTSGSARCGTATRTSARPHSGRLRTQWPGSPPSTAGEGWRLEPRALADLLGPALAASDALARLDARAGATSEPVREGLVRRLALHEAAGWLATQGAWVHPLDLALRAGAPASPFGLAAAIGRGGDAEHPGHKCRRRLERVGRHRQSLRARTVRRRAGRRRRGPGFAPRASAETPESAEHPRPTPQRPGVGAGARRFERGHARPGARRRLAPDRSRRHRRGPAGPSGAGAPLPPLLAAAWAAQAWSEDGGCAAQALFGAAALLSRAGALRAVPLPFWAAYPALGRGGRLPGVRKDAIAPETAGPARRGLWRSADLPARRRWQACASWAGWRRQPSGAGRRRRTSTGARACRTPLTLPCACRR